jgi:phospholipid-binding lipoprotein MlaA
MTSVLRSTSPVLCVALLFALAGCGGPQPGSTVTTEINDPYENSNRSVHELNLKIDQAVFGPASKGVSGVVPPPIQDSIGYFARNFSMPAVTVNALLQGDLKVAGQSLARFAINSTVGFAGLADPATDFKVPQTDTDFGATLHSWGVGEGAYVELPFFGPSTQRDAVGSLVTFFSNPLLYVFPSNGIWIGLGVEIVGQVTDRGRFSDTVDSILYDSADSYAQTRLIYLQNRRFELGDAAAEEDDPFDLDTEGF